MTETRKPPNEDALREEARRLLREHGVRQAAHLLGIHYQTLLAMAAGAPVRSGSFAMMREYMRRSTGSASRHPSNACGLVELETP